MADSTILLGQNNEGKSNLLAALATAMTVVSQLAGRTLTRGRVQMDPRIRGIYNWQRDFPIPLQDDHQDGESVFRLEFQLSEPERAQFKEEVHSTLNDTLPVEIKLGKGNPAFRVVKRGPGSEKLNAKGTAIANFIGSRVEVTYIPAVRTAEASLQEIRRLVGRELHALDDNADYQRAIARIAQLQKPILEKLSQRIGEGLREFLPSVTNVSVDVSDDERYRALRRNVTIMVDDGIPTALERKGDGVQSLVAISVLRGVEQSKLHSILALEEPESHLHPSAIHRLRQVIDQLGAKHQIVITTHCPLFVDRVNLTRNILVTGNNATPAKSLREIRELLGVRASDNLLHANLVLVVEGEADRVMAAALLAQSSPLLMQALKANTLVIDILHGASKLVYKLDQLQLGLCNVHCYLDNDDAGRGAIESAEAELLLKPSDRHLAVCPGMASSEFEDLLRTDVYADAIRAKYTVDLGKPTFRTSRKWTERISATFATQGQPWNARIERDVKTLVADQVRQGAENALEVHKRSSFDALVAALEEKLRAATTKGWLTHALRPTARKS